MYCYYFEDLIELALSLLLLLLMTWSISCISITTTTLKIGSYLNDNLVKQYNLCTNHVLDRSKVQTQFCTIKRYLQAQTQLMLLKAWTSSKLSFTIQYTRGCIRGCTKGSWSQSKGSLEFSIKHLNPWALHGLKTNINYFSKISWCTLDIL